MMRLFFLLVFVGFHGFGQKIVLEEQGPLLNAILDPGKEEIRLYFDDHYNTIDLNSFALGRHELVTLIDPRIGDDPLRYQLLIVQGIDYFVKGSGGIVYKFENDTVHRIDQSFDHHMDYGAAVFEHENTLFKYGGYGYWSVRDFFIFFDPGVLEWDAYGPIDDSMIPDGITSSLFIKTGDNFQMFGGYSIGRSNRKDKIINQKIWNFNFKRNEWKYVGEHKPIEMGFQVAAGNNLLLIRDNEIEEIDLLGNKIRRFDHSPITARIHVFRHAFYHEGKFFVLMDLNGPIGLFVVEREDFFGRLKSEGQFYARQNDWIKPALQITMALVVLVLAGYFARKELKRRKKVVLLENGLRYKNKFVEFKPDSMKILRLLLSQLEVPSGSILEIVEQEQYSPAHNERLKVQKIRDMNLKLKTLLGISDDLIVSVKSRQDKRIRVYKISRQHFF